MIDYSALKTAFQMKITDRRSARFNEWSMYLFTFLSRMTIVHRKKKTYQNANDLFRLSTTTLEKKTEFYYMNRFYHTCFFTIVISDQKDFLKKIIENIIKNWYFVKIMKKLKNQIQKTMNRNEKFNVKWQTYRFDFETKFFYFKNKKNSNRLCILESCHKRILHYAHDEHAHEGMHRTYDLFMKSVFISKMKMLINDYVISCSTCQLFKPSRQFSYEKLKSISFSNELLTELSLDFIIELSMISNENNVILTIIDRFSKYVKIVSEKKTFSIEKWSSFYWKYIFKNWKTSARLINDRDSKFNSDFWKAVFNQCDIKLKIITAYHFSTNDQAERFNQTVKTTLKCFLIDKYEENWKNILSQIEYSINCFENRSIEISSFEILYDVKSKNFLLKIIRRNQNLFSNEMNFFEIKKQIRLNVIDSIKMTQIKMSMLYDVKHRSSNLTDKIYIKIAKQNHFDYHISEFSSLTIKKLNSFRIIRKIENLAYELKLSINMKIHSIISVIHLKQTKKNDFDKKNSINLISDFIIVNDKLQYVVERLFRKKIKNKKFKYWIKWKEYEEITWQSKNEFLKNIFEMIRKFNERKTKNIKIKSSDSSNEWNIYWKSFWN